MTISLTAQHQELGKVNWLRNYDTALLTSEKKNRPILILFQEVPGCATCRNYGNDVLSDPLMVDIIENFFVPLCIFNNHKGEDAKVLKKYGEPSWNNPVVRIIDHSNEKDITKRLNGRYDMEGLIVTISNGILASNKIIPEYLVLLQQVYSSIDLRETHLAMFCFWSGEKNVIFSTLSG